MSIVNLEELARKLQDRFADMLYATLEGYMPDKIVHVPAGVEHTGVAVDLTKPKYDLSRVTWEDAEGARGPYLRAWDSRQIHVEDRANYNALHDALVDAGGSIFGKTEVIWLFSNGSAIGRKPRV
jgi:hypothetical protein